MAGLTDNDLVWRALAKYHPDLFCGLYLQESNEGIGINEENLSLLAQRGISLSLDVYCRRRLKLVR
jgi:hypothetical protein